MSNRRGKRRYLDSSRPTGQTTSTHASRDAGRHVEDIDDYFSRWVVLVIRRNGYRLALMYRIVSDVAPQDVSAEISHMTSIQYFEI